MDDVRGDPTSRERPCALGYVRVVATTSPDTRLDDIPLLIRVFSSLRRPLELEMLSWLSPQERCSPENSCVRGLEHNCTSTRAHGLGSRSNERAGEPCGRFRLTWNPDAGPDLSAEGERAIFDSEGESRTLDANAVRRPRLAALASSTYGSL